MKAESGLLLGGRYRLDELLATGGMGEVWTGHDEAVGRVVAVKVLREEFTGNQEFLRRLRTEARNSSALSHQNIAQMYDYGEQNGTGFLVMELVPGEPLADLLDRKPVLPPNELIPILSATARGLQHAHQASVVHRDVKPGNILLQATIPGVPPTVKITDFGVSLAANQAPMTATGMVMGTAQYLSPEQAIGKSATGRSDLYALGVIAYEATAGKRPFTGKSPVDIAVAHVNDPVPPLPPDTNPHLAHVVMKLLEKEPENRYATAGELADELDQIQAELTRPPSQLGERSWLNPQPGAAHQVFMAPDRQPVTTQPGVSGASRPSAATPPTPVGGMATTPPPLVGPESKSAQPSVSPQHSPVATLPGSPPVAPPWSTPNQADPPMVVAGQREAPVVIVPGTDLPPRRRSARDSNAFGSNPPAIIPASSNPPAASNLSAARPQPMLVPRSNVVANRVMAGQVGPSGLFEVDQPGQAGLPSQVMRSQQQTTRRQPPIPRYAILLIVLLAVLAVYFIIRALLSSNSEASAYTECGYSVSWLDGLQSEKADTPVFGVKGYTSG